MTTPDSLTLQIEPDLRSRLEDFARRDGTDVGRLLDRLIREWLASRAGVTGLEQSQRDLHEAAAKTIGSLRGSDSGRAENAEQTVKRRIAAKLGRRKDNASGA